MKKNLFFKNLLIFILGITIFSACTKEENDKKGFVTFGANYHIINCITNVTIYVDHKKIGTLKNPTNTIKNCGEDTNITKELPIGKHSYKVEIRPEMGIGCTKDITGTFTISKDQCKKIFIDYLKVFKETK